MRQPWPPCCTPGWIARMRNTEASTSLALRFLEGAVWTSARNLLQIAVSLVALAVVARELGPETYGLFGIAMIVFGIAEMAAGGSASDFLVPRKLLEDGYTDATFWASLLSSIALALLLAEMAVPLAQLAGDARASEPLAALAWVLPMAVGSRIPMALLARDLRFRAIAQISALATVASCITGIVLAVRGAGAWTLVVMESVRAATVLVGSWWAVSWRPGLRLGWRDLHELTRVWANTLATYSLGYADLMLPRLLVAHLLGPQALGLFNLALRVPQELSRLLIDPLYDVAMSACARAKITGDDVQRLIIGLYGGARLIVWPTFLGMAALAPWLVPAMFGPQWQAAVVAMQVLLLACVRTATGSFNPAILYGTGHIRSSLVLFAFGCVMTVALFPLLAPFGIVGAAAAMTGRMLLDWPLASSLIKRATGLPLRRQVGGSIGLLACAVLAALAIGVTGKILGPHVSSWVIVGAAPLAGACVYLGALRWFTPETLRQAVEMLRAFVSRDKTRLEALLARA